MNVEKNYNIALGINDGIKPVEYSFLEDKYVLPVVSLSPQISYKRCLGFINYRCRIGLQFETSAWDVEIEQQGVKGDISRQDVSVYFGSTIYQFWQQSRSFSLSYSIGYTAGRTEIEYDDGLSLLSTEAGNFVSLSANIGFSERNLLSLRIASGYLWDMQYQSKRAEQPLDDVRLGDYRSPDFSGGIRWYFLLSKSVDIIFAGIPQT